MDLDSDFYRLEKLPLVKILNSFIDLIETGINRKEEYFHEIRQQKANDMWKML